MTEPAASATSVLEATPPRFTPAEVSAIALELFGIDGEARELGSERDQAFMIDDGDAGGVVKISNLGEDPEALDLETAAILHIGRADPDLPVARPQLALGLTDDRIRPLPADHRRPRGPPLRAPVRADARPLPVPGSELDDARCRAYGATLARLGRALRGFFHPAAGRSFLWDTKNALGLRPLVTSIPDARPAAMVDAAARPLRRARRAAPGRELRAQVIHSDFGAGQRAARRPRPGGRHHRLRRHRRTARWSTDLALALASVLRTAAADDVFRAARLLIDGYQSVTPLEPLELELLADLLAARLCTIVVDQRLAGDQLSRERRVHPGWDPGSWMLIDQFDRGRHGRGRAGAGRRRPPVADAELARAPARRRWAPRSRR